MKPIVTITDVSEYWNNNPCNVASIEAPIGSKEFFAKHTLMKYKEEPFVRNFVDFFSWKNKLVLEIGCGIGADTMQFVLAGAKITALDLSAEAVALTKLRVGELASIVQANAEELNQILPPQYYDLIYCYGVLHHTPNPRHVIKQLTTYFSIRGTILKLMLYNKWSARGLKVQLGLGETELIPGCPIAKLYSRRDIKKLLGKDWEIQEMKTANYGWNFLVTACRI